MKKQELISELKILEASKESVLVAKKKIGYIDIEAIEALNKKIIPLRKQLQEIIHKEIKSGKWA